MIRTETIDDGRIHTWSDAGYKIRQETGTVYDDAIDSVPHTYTETVIPVDDEAMLTAKAEAYDILTGVSE